MIDETADDVDDGSYPVLTLDELTAFVEADSGVYGDTTLGPVVVVDGHDVGVRVRDGCLVLIDGVKPNRRERRIEPLDKTVQSVIVLGAGFVTTEAMAWCVDHGVELAVLRTGERPTSMTPGLLYDSAGIRRWQARMAGTTQGVDIFRGLVRQRITDMAEIAERLSPEHAVRIKERLAHLDSLRSVHALQVAAESQAAKLYWVAWRNVELRFAWRAPTYYRHFESRRSSIAWTPGNTRASNVRTAAKTIAQRRSNRHAITPTNAMLNLGYKLAQSQVVYAMIGAGLDPGLGFAHADAGKEGLADRPSGALDLMEVCRGVVESHVLDLIETRRFGRADFRRLPHGEMRVGPPLSHLFATLLAPRLRRGAVEQAALLRAAALSTCGRR